MFSNKEKDLDRIETLIGEGCCIIGCITGNGLLKIDGSIDGDVFSEDDIVLGDAGQLKGNTICNNAFIHGTVEGNVTCKNTLTIENCGNVKGDISVKKLMISEGGILDGKCTMVSYIKPNVQEDKL